MNEAATAISAASQAAARAFDNYQQRFASVDTSLAQTLTKLRDGIIELGNHVTEVVTQYDEHLSKAVGSLGHGVEEIVEAIENLNDRPRRAA